MELFDYQKQGIEFLVSRQGGMLLDEQGLGKTLQALEAVNRSDSKLLVVVCPAIMQGTWLHHITKYLNKDIEYIIHSYEWYNNSNHIKEVYKKINKLKTSVVVDECHYIKTPTSKRSKTVYQMLLLENIKQKILLTGTPITRDIDDLYMPMSVFYNGTNNWYKSIFHFRRDLMKCKHSYFGDVYSGFKSEYSKNLLIGMLKRISLRRTKKQVLSELPAISRQRIYIDIDAKVAKESLKYLDYATYVINKDTENATKYEDYASQMKEDATHIATVRKALGIAKVKGTLEYIDLYLETSKVDKLVVFAVHQDVISLLVNALKEKYKDKYMIHEITGATPRGKRDKMIESFQTDEKPQILVANMIACGVGVTLTKAHTVVFAELDFTPSNIMQAEARVHRITQEHIVNSIFIIANESLDAKILGLIKDKLTVIKDVLQTSS